MHVDIQRLFAAALIGVGVVSFVLAMLFLFARSKRRAAEAEMRRAWEESMAAVDRPTYDGDTYVYEGGWTPDTLALYLRDPNPTTHDLPVLKVPPSEMSGPLPATPFQPGYDPQADADEYIAEMTARMTAFRLAMTE